MDINKFSPRVRAYIEKNFNSISEASRHYGHHTSYLLKCLGGQRSFPKTLLDDMGYEVEKKYTPNYTKKKIPDCLKEQAS
jgi:hypothetical protein